IDRDGKPVFVGLQAVAAESTDAWDGFLTDLKARGLGPPLLGISDGAGGLISAFELHFPHSLRQRCVIHRLRNALAKVSKPDQDEFKADWWAIFNDIDAEPGQAAIAEARRRADRFVAKWADRYPSAVKCLTDDFASLTTHLRFPTEHRKRIRHSNFIERTFGETRRRVKVIGRMPGETSCVSLVWPDFDGFWGGFGGRDAVTWGYGSWLRVREPICRGKRSLLCPVGVWDNRRTCS
ncbi:MAG TPA: transposase, partial [Acidimicrobiia bacterium]|nr:transposase [Acidimicrobiia bacterium]